MKTLNTVGALRTFRAEEQRAGRRVALVPTMGALHAGHLSLVEEARRRADTVIVSIFVNPTQFGPKEDLAAYPCDLEGDLARCRRAGVAAVFVPSPTEMYPDGAETFVEVERLQRPLCGRSRPHHFRGVATVVAKLLIAAQPHIAVFGEKDYQQLQVVRRMARDLLLDVEIVGAPIAREDDGLARSSRNVYLGPALRHEAQVLARALDAAEAMVAMGERSGATLLERARKEIGAAPHAEIDYVELRDPETLEPAPDNLASPTLLALAVFFPGTGTGSPARVRLIDNRVIEPGIASHRRARGDR